MITVISPAKSLNFQPPASKFPFREPPFLQKASEIMSELKMMSLPEMKSLMNISDKLAMLNAERHSDWVVPHDTARSLQAVFAFDGDVYDGIRAREMPAAGIKFADKHLRILSGLYGVLRPLDHIMAYRLEMGIKKSFAAKKNLYDYWKIVLQSYFTEEVKRSGSPVILNLASQEYSKALLPLPASSGVRVAEALFFEQKGSKLQMVSFYAKKARGLMSRFIIENRIDDLELIEGFDYENYLFRPELSDDKKKIFVR